MTKRPPPGHCVHCLKKYEELTWDHVFPEFWYPDTTPKNTEKWKIPSCSSCNKVHGENEDDLLIRFGLCLDPDSMSSMGIEEKALRALNPEAGRNDRDSKARASKCTHLLNKLLISPNIPHQAIYPGFGSKAQSTKNGQVAITVGARKLKKLTEKIVRGLTYLEGGQFIEDRYNIEHVVVTEVDAKDFQVFLDRYGKTYERLPGFKVRRAVTPENAVCGIFEIEIWSQLRLFALVTPKAD